MALETGTYISDLVSTNPVSSDNISQGDDHIRLLKSTIKATFPNITGAVTPTHTDLNKLTASGSPQFSTIELGHASDTTITRSAVGVIAVEGGVVPKENRANTFSADQVINANVGIGTTPSTKFHVVGPSGGESARFTDNVNSTLAIKHEAGGLLTYEAFGAISHRWVSNTLERMRITGGGFVYMGSSSQIGTNGTLQVRGISGSTFAAAFDNGSASAGPAAFNRSDDGSIMRFYQAWSGGGVGNISVTSTATSYNTSSDYRLKESIQPVNDPIARLMALKPINFAWKIDGSRVDGFIAHEAAEVVPEAVTGAKDAVDDEGNAVYQSIDQSKLVPLLTAALQEALTEISSLKARIDALEAA